MDFSRELRDDVISGDISVSFRLWRRPRPGSAAARRALSPEQ
jgi:hypothetical protein